jgi:hypothetical protein
MGAFLCTQPLHKKGIPISPRAGFVSWDQVVPRLKSAIPNIYGVGAGDHNELIQDSIANAARFYSDPISEGWSKRTLALCSTAIGSKAVISLMDAWFRFADAPVRSRAPPGGRPRTPPHHSGTSTSTPGVYEAAQGRANCINSRVGKNGLDSRESFLEEYPT